MRIFYAGQLGQGSTTRDRMCSLTDLGHQIVPFDTTPYLTFGTRIVRVLAHRLNRGAPVRAFNSAFHAAINAAGRVDLVWVDKGRWIWPSTLTAIRETSNARLIHYTPDPQLYYHRSHLFRECIRLYDIVVTTKRYEVEAYRRAGARLVLQVLQGFHRRFVEYGLARSTAGRRPDTNVVFVGHCESHYARRLRTAGAATNDLAVFGAEWPNYAQRHAWARRVVRGGGQVGEQYLLCLSRARIALGLLSKIVPDASTTRSFEIPALGTFLLAERSDEHLELFTEGVDAEFFSDDEELRDKIRFYLRNDDARSRIGVAGRDRCLKSGYSSEAQLSRVIEALNQ